ncbi:hypothetical protein AAFF_G00410720 [Aldrovandia affinis]|uniref:Uncharacterized protein n=1 Tax=Aldrovandia affinis TaxID=143900 RepID=A0AAD7R3G8_9TELE|nr:hypothetical protein AAFF_G00410720 [Aldrovandia affinis]
MRDVMKSIDTIRQEADKRMRAQQSRQSGQQCGPVELKKEVSFKAQPSPPSISSQTGQQTEKQNGDSSPTGVVMLRNALKFLDSIGQKSDKRLRAQQSGEQCGPVGLMKEEDSFKAQFGTVENNVWDKFQRRLPTQKQNGDSSLAGVVRMRDVMKSIDTIRQEADKRMRAQQSRQSGQQCGPVELKKEVSFKAQPSPPSISSQTGQQTEKQNGDSSPTGVVMLRNALKFLDSIGQKSDKRLRAQQSGEQCGPVGLMKEEDSFKAQKWRFFLGWSGADAFDVMKSIDTIRQEADKRMTLLVKNSHGSQGNSVGRWS